MKTVLALVVIFAAVQASASDLDRDQQRMLEGVAWILVAEQKCGLKVDAKKLNEWLAKNNLLSPTAYSWLNDTVRFNLRTNPPSETECSVIAATARSMGVLAMNAP